MEQLQELVSHAKLTGQTPTHWVLAKGAEGVIYKEETHGFEGAELVGLPVQFDAELPLNKAVLKCGQNSAGAAILPVFLNLD